jgi:hypothetical protein
VTILGHVSLRRNYPAADANPLSTNQADVPARLGSVRRAPDFIWSIAPDAI